MSLHNLLMNQGKNLSNLPSFRQGGKGDVISGTESLQTSSLPLSGGGTWKGAALTLVHLHADRTPGIMQVMLFKMPNPVVISKDKYL